MVSLWAIRGCEASRSGVETFERRFEDFHTGESVAERWARLNPAERRDYLLRAETTVSYGPDKNGHLLAQMHIPARGLNKLRMAGGR